MKGVACLVVAHQLQHGRLEVKLVPHSLAAQHANHELVQHGVLQSSGQLAAAYLFSFCIHHDSVKLKLLACVLPGVVPFAKDC